MVFVFEKFVFRVVADCVFGTIFRLCAPVCRWRGRHCASRRRITNYNFFASFSYPHAVREGLSWLTNYGHAPRLRAVSVLLCKALVPLCVRSDKAFIFCSGFCSLIFFATSKNLWETCSPRFRMSLQQSNRKIQTKKMERCLS